MKEETKYFSQELTIPLGGYLIKKEEKTIEVCNGFELTLDEFYNCYLIINLKNNKLLLVKNYIECGYCGAKKYFATKECRRKVYDDYMTTHRHNLTTLYPCECCENKFECNRDEPCHDEWLCSNCEKICTSTHKFLNVKIHATQSSLIISHDVHIDDAELVFKDLTRVKSDLYPLKITISFSDKKNAHRFILKSRNNLEVFDYKFSDAFYYVSNYKFDEILQSSKVLRESLFEALSVRGAIFKRINDENLTLQNIALLY